MVGVIAKLVIQEGKIDEAIELFKELMKSVAEEEGTLFYTMNRDKANPNTLIIMERYKDKEALEAHSTTPQFKAFFKKIGGLLSEKPETSFLEEIHSI